MTVPLPPPEASPHVHHPLVTNVRSLPPILAAVFLCSKGILWATSQFQSRRLPERLGRPQGASQLLPSACKAPNDESVSEIWLVSQADGTGPWPPGCLGLQPMHGAVAHRSAPRVTLRSLACCSPPLGPLPCLLTDPLLSEEASPNLSAGFLLFWRRNTKVDSDCLLVQHQ